MAPTQPVESICFVHTCEAVGWPCYDDGRAPRYGNSGASARVLSTEQSKWSRININSVTHSQSLFRLKFTPTHPCVVCRTSFRPFLVYFGCALHARFPVWIYHPLPHRHTHQYNEIYEWPLHCKVLVQYSSEVTCAAVSACAQLAFGKVVGGYQEVLAVRAFTTPTQLLCSLLSFLVVGKTRDVGGHTDSHPGENTPND